MRIRVTNVFIVSTGYENGKIVVEPFSAENKGQGWTLGDNRIINSNRNKPGVKVCLDIWHNKRVSGSRLCEYQIHGTLNQMVEWNMVLV